MRLLHKGREEDANTGQQDVVLILMAGIARRYRDQRDRPDLTNPDSLALYLESQRHTVVALPSSEIPHFC